MDCRECQRFVHIYLDGELDERDRGEIEGHLAACDPCRAQARFERWFREGVKRNAPVEAPPPDLRARICAELAKVPAVRRAERWRRFSIPIAATVAVGGFAAYIASADRAGTSGEGAGVMGAAAVPSVTAPSARVEASRPASEQGPTRLAAAPPSLRAIARAASAPGARRVAAALAREVEEANEVVAPAAPPSSGDRDLDLQLESSNPERVRAFLEEQLDRPLRIPTFRGRARVLGGSASSNDTTAQVLYRYKGDNLYLHIRTRHDPTLPPRGIVVRQEDGHRVAAWQHDGLTFSMTSRLDPVEMVRLVASELADLRRAPASVASSPPRERNLSEWPGAVRGSDVVPASMSSP